MAGMSDMPGMTAPAAASSSPATASNVSAVGATLEIHAFDLGFRPNALSVAAAGTYAVKFVNDGAVQHNLTFADGTKLTRRPRQDRHGLDHRARRGPHFPV